jgi:hypothetical protein
MWPVIRAINENDFDAFSSAIAKLVRVFKKNVAAAPRTEPKRRFNHPKRDARTAITKLTKAAIADLEAGREPRDRIDAVYRMVTEKTEAFRSEKKDYEARTKFLADFEHLHKMAVEIAGGGEKLSTYNHSLGKKWKTCQEMRSGDNEKEESYKIDEIEIGRILNPLFLKGRPERLEFALHYSDLGLPIFPCHTIVLNGSNRICTCRRGLECDRPGKHPRTRFGHNEATPDREKIIEWWTNWPEANIGLATGRTSRIIVIDLDRDKGGEYTLEALQEAWGEHEALTATLTAYTGRGRHLFLEYPDKGFSIIGSVEKVGPGIDVRSDGNYVILPPSLHYSGRTYRWHGCETEIQILPAWLLFEILVSEPAIQTTILKKGMHYTSIREPIPEGTRNDKLLRDGCGLINSFPVESAQTRLETVNDASCSPPLPVAELRKVIRSVAKYSKNPNKLRRTEDYQG